MSFKPWCCALLCAVMLASACSTTTRPAVESLGAVPEADAAAPAAPAAAAPDAVAACDGVVFMGQCAEKGSTVTFGQYPQAAQSPEPIQWIVLDIMPKAEVADGRILLLSKYVIDARPYHSEREAITWEECSLRAWLNGDFMEAAFGTDEKSQILLTHLENPDNPHTGINGGNPTNDNVFLLSLGDVLDKADDVSGSGRLFSGNRERRTTATTHAIENGVWVDTEQGTNGVCATGQCSARWWLRTPGYFEKSAQSVDRDGYGLTSSDVDGGSVGVRPAVWVRY